MTHCANSVATGSRLYLTVDHCGNALLRHPRSSCRSRTKQEPVANVPRTC
jgi:hypothetical protein